MLVMVLTAVVPVLAQDGPPGPPPNEEYATFSFELAVECEPPANARFFGQIPAEGMFSTPLTGPDGDGLYTGSITVPQFPPGPRPVPPDMEPVSLPVRIVQGPPTGYSAMGPEYRVIKDFGVVEAQDRTFEADVSFCSGGGNEKGEEPGQVQPQCFLPEGCFLSGDARDEKIVGGMGPDYIIGGHGHDALYGLGAGDWLDGGAGDDLVRGGVGDDLVDGGSGDDLVIGGDGNDYVTGYLGSDALNGGGGSDYIYAADGEFDRVSGGPGYDVCVVDEEDDVNGCEEVRVQ
jgi:hypothetical protein